MYCDSGLFPPWLFFSSSSSSSSSYSLSSKNSSTIFYLESLLPWNIFRSSPSEFLLDLLAYSILAKELANWLVFLLRLLFIVDYLGSIRLPVSLLLLIVVCSLLFSPVDICSNNWDVATEDEDRMPPNSLWLLKSPGDYIGESLVIFLTDGLILFIYYWMPPPPPPLLSL